MMGFDYWEPYVLTSRLISGWSRREPAGPMSGGGGACRGWWGGVLICYHVVRTPTHPAGPTWAQIWSAGRITCSREGEGVPGGFKGGQGVSGGGGGCKGVSGGGAWGARGCHGLLNCMFYQLLRVQHSCSSTQSWGSVLPSIVEMRDQNSRGCPLLFSNRNLGSFCA